MMHGIMWIWASYYFYIRIMCIKCLFYFKRGTKWTKRKEIIWLSRLLKKRSALETTEILFDEEENIKF